MQKIPMNFERGNQMVKSGGHGLLQKRPEEGVVYFPVSSKLIDM